MGIEVSTSAALVQASGRRSRRRPRHGPVSATERLFFTERLVLLLDTGHTLHASLDVLKGQSPTPGLSAVIGAILEQVHDGATFSAALREHRDVFSSTYVNLVAAAERGGFLTTVLRELVQMERNANELRATVTSALTYPVFLSVFSTAVVIFVLSFVFPKFSVMFVSIADRLPLSTVVLMALSDYIIGYWPWILAGLGALTAASWLALRSDAGASLIDDLKLRLPGLRTVIVEFYLIQTMRVMSLSLGHGVTVLDTLAACRDVVPNRRFRAFMDEVSRDVESGEGLHGAFERCTFLPVLAKQLVRTGEESASLALVFERIAEFYETELSRRIESFAKLVEPVMLLVMGAIVGLIVASLVLPIFQLSKGAH